jgi:hypothetical protein
LPLSRTVRGDGRRTAQQTAADLVARHDKVLLSVAEAHDGY